MKKILSLLSLSILLFGVSAWAEGKCPVSGKATDGSVVSKVNDTAVEFCCEKCQAKYEKELNVTDAGADKCPISGKAADPDHRVLHTSATANYFCCEKCVAKFTKEKGFADVKNEEPGKCQYSGKDADPEAVVNVNGKLTYFCCDKCVAKFKTSLAAADKGPEKCQYSQKDADAEQVVFLQEAKAVYFCCDKCEAKYIKENCTAKAAE